MSKVDISNALPRLPMFQELSPEQIAVIAAETQERHLSRGEILFHKGDSAKGFFVIISGQVKLAFQSSQGNEKIVEIMGPGQSFGEAVMFMDRPCPVMAEAIAESVVLYIGRNAVFSLLETDASFARRLLAGLSMRLHSLVQDVESYSLRSSSQRVIGFLMQQGSQDIPGKAALEFTLPASKHVIASRLNLTPETLSRVFHNLSEQGLIAVDGKLITILDLKRLRDFEL